MVKTSYRSAVVYHLTKWDYIGRKVQWKEGSRNAIGGLFTYIVPFLWIVYVVYAIAVMVSVPSYVASTKMKQFPVVAGQTKFYLPDLTCIAPGGCRLSPLLDHDASRDLGTIKASCSSKLTTIIERTPGNDTRGRPPPGIRQLVELDPGIVRPQDGGTVVGRECYAVGCGQDVTLESHRKMYYDYDPTNRFRAVWTNSTFGFALFVPELDEVTGNVVASIVRIPRGLVMLQVVHKIHAYYGIEVIQYFPHSVHSLPKDYDWSSNACCMKQSADFNSEFGSASSGAANCTAEDVSHLELQIYPTYFEETIYRQFAWADAFGLCGGALFLISATVVLLANVGESLRLRWKTQRPSISSSPQSHQSEKIGGAARNAGIVVDKDHGMNLHIFLTNEEPTQFNEGNQKTDYEEFD